MPDRPHSEAIRQRFVEAVEETAAAGYPKDATVVSVANSVGLAPTNFYRLRRPGNYPTFENCVELCLQHGYSPLWLFMGEGPKKQINGKKMKPLELLKAGVAAIEGEMKALSRQKK